MLPSETYRRFSVVPAGLPELTLLPFRLCRQNTNVKDQEDATVIDLQEPVSLSFALKYINSFAKATPLSPQVCFQTCRAYLKCHLNLSTVLSAFTQVFTLLLPLSLDLSLLADPRAKR